MEQRDGLTSSSPAQTSCGPASPHSHSRPQTPPRSIHLYLAGLQQDFSRTSAGLQQGTGGHSITTPPSFSLSSSSLQLSRPPRVLQSAAPSPLPPLLLLPPPSQYSTVTQFLCNLFSVSLSPQKEKGGSPDLSQSLLSSLGIH